MFSKRLTSTVSTCELQALRSRWLRSGKCDRCFHVAVRQMVDEAPSEATQGTPLNAPNRGPTRQQRKAMVAKDVQMVQRDHPSPSFSQADPDTLRPSGASQTIDSEAIGLNVGGGSMGQNDTASQEGPYAEGVNVNSRTDVDAGADTRAARSTGQPTTVESSSERAGSGMEHGLGMSSGARLNRKTEEDKDGNLDERIHAPPHSTSPVDVSQAGRSSTAESLYGLRGCTIVGGNLQRVVEERLSILLGQEAHEGERDPTDLARELLKRRFVQFASTEERAAVLEEAKRIARPSRGEKSESRHAAPQVQTVPESVRRTMVDSMVAGQYDSDGSLQGGERFKQPVLNNIARTLTMNGTYLKEDGERVLKKVSSLLPASAQQSPRKVVR